jgi:prophage regulatory protein
LDRHEDRGDLGVRHPIRKAAVAACGTLSPSTNESAIWAAAPEYLDSVDLEKLIGTKASTWRYWAMLDQYAESEEERSGPASFKLGRRRVWRKSSVLQWLAKQETAQQAPIT